MASVAATPPPSPKPSTRPHTSRPITRPNFWRPFSPMSPAATTPPRPWSRMRASGMSRSCPSTSTEAGRATMSKLRVRSSRFKAQPELETRDPKLETRNSRPETRDPKLETRNSIRMGFLQVKGLSEDTAEGIVEARAGGPFRNLVDFWRRTSVDRDVAHNLIVVGAFDDLGVARRKLLWQLDEVVRTVPKAFDVQRSTFKPPGLSEQSSSARPSPQKPQPLELEFGKEELAEEPLPDFPPLTE